MMTHLLTVALTLPLPGAAPQQQPPRPTPFNRPIVIPLRPNPPPPPKPKPPPKSGITAPKPTTRAPRPNPSVGPIEARTESLDLSGWVKVSPTAIGLVFYMPEEPTEQRRTIRAGERELDLVQYVLSMGDSGAYVVMYSDLPEERSAMEENILGAARDRVLETLQGRLLNENRVEAGDTPGLELQVQAPGEIVVRQQMFIKGNRFFQAIAAGPKAFVSSPDADKYFRAIRFEESGER